jgi:hypothetical protein
MKNKRGQELFGMSFGVIFSIIIIIFILIIAGIAIKHFLNLKNCAQIGIFLDDFQKQIDKAWNSQKSNFPFTSSLPTNLDYVCFANLTDKISGTEIEKQIAGDFEVYEFSGGNLFFYPIKNSCEIPYYKLKHINLEEITSQKNPYCIKIRKSYN